jgi:hypothetical protein
MLIRLTTPIAFILDLSSASYPPKGDFPICSLDTLDKIRWVRCAHTYAVKTTGEDQALAMGKCINIRHFYRGTHQSKNRTSKRAVSRVYGIATIACANANSSASASKTIQLRIPSFS